MPAADAAETGQAPGRYWPAATRAGDCGTGLSDEGVDEPGRSSDVGDDESLEVVQGGAGVEFGERAVVAVVGTVESVAVAVAEPLKEDRRGRPSRTSSRFNSNRPARPLPSRNGWIVSKAQCSRARRSGSSPADSDPTVGLCPSVWGE